ncbi:MAG: hypothetical protein S0880_10275 [Actinomycetota bacterium]|nr:hypothetical protein [Actinomycetota bacterium]
MAYQRRARRPQAPPPRPRARGAQPSGLLGPTGRPLNRVDGRTPPQARNTYQILQPLDTHWRPASCAEYRCKAHLRGWATAVDEATPLGRRQAAYIRAHCVRDTGAHAMATSGRRRYTETHEAGLTEFRFPAGQECFQEHRVPLDRPQRFLVRHGDVRRFGGVVRDHGERGDLFVEDMAHNLDRVRTAVTRG